MVPKRVQVDTKKATSEMGEPIKKMYGVLPRTETNGRISERPSSSNIVNYDDILYTR